MAKRFIDTDLFKRPRFKDLKAPYKLLWVYLMCECNHAGLWNVELDVAGLRIGQKLPEDCATVMGHMIQVVDGGRKWWLKDFVRFQYGAELVTTNRMHASVIRELETWGLMEHLEEVSTVDQGTSVNAVRQRLSKKMKSDVLMRDDLTCQYCGTQKPAAELVVDHIVPVIKGGDNSDDNLVACCLRCNGHKSDLSLDEFLSREHAFLNPLEGVIKKLKAPYKPLLGAKDKDKDKEQELTQEKEERAKPEAKVIPMPFTSEAFALAFAAFDDMRRKKGNRMTDHARNLILRKLTAMGEPSAIESLNKSTISGWADVFPPKGESLGAHSSTIRTADPKRAIPNGLT